MPSPHIDAATKN